MLKALVVLALVAAAYAAIPSSQRSALMDFYSSAGGKNWIRNDNWGQGDPCDNNWIGVFCDPKGITVHRLELPKNQLSGYVHSSISALTDLVSFRMDQNRLGGSFPTSISQLSGIQILQIPYNKFTGGLDFIGSWRDCHHLEVNNNLFTGTIPDAFAEFDELLWLDLAYNGLTGTLPPSIVKPKQLEFLHLSDNQLSGELYNPNDGIYESIFWLPQLAELYVEDNLFNGPLPDSLTHGKSRLNYFWANNNRLNGTVPTWVCDEFSYNLADNRFSSCSSCCKEECSRGYIKCCGCTA